MALHRPELRSPAAWSPRATSSVRSGAIRSQGSRTSEFISEAEDRIAALAGAMKSPAQRAGVSLGVHPVRVEPCHTPTVRVTVCLANRPHRSPHASAELARGARSGRCAWPSDAAGGGPKRSCYIGFRARKCYLQIPGHRLEKAKITGHSQSPHDLAESNIFIRIIF